MDKAKKTAGLLRFFQILVKVIFLNYRYGRNPCEAIDG